MKQHTDNNHTTFPIKSCFAAYTDTTYDSFLGFVNSPIELSFYEALEVAALNYPKYKHTLVLVHIGSGVSI